MKLSDLKPNEGQIEGVPSNPRTITEDDFEKLKKSLVNFRKMLSLRPMIVDEDWNILGGNMRYQALCRLRDEGVDGFTEDIPDEWVKQDTTLSAAEKREFVIKDNQQRGRNDWDALANEWDDEELREWDVEAAEWSADFPDDSEDKNNANEDDFNYGKDEIQTICKEGDIWQLGEHRLMCGDSTDEKQVKTLMGWGKLADLFLTDPPYNVDYEGEHGLKIQNDKMGDSAFYNFLVDSFNAANAVLRKGCAIYIWHADSEGYNFRSAFKAAGWTLRQCLIWVKNSLVMGRQDYQWKHEPCLYGWKDGAAHYFTNIRTETTTIEDDVVDFDKMEKNELVEIIKTIQGDNIESTVIREKRPQVNAEHPTMKPIKLLARLINNSSKQGDMVLDTFGGSGSTLIACEQLNRICYTMELDPHYCDVIIARWEKLTGEKAVLINRETNE